MQGFRARSQLLIKRLEEEDEVMQEDLSDLSSEDDDDDDEVEEDMEVMEGQGNGQKNRYGQF